MNLLTRTTYRRIRRLPDGTETSTVHDCIVWYPQWTRWVVTDRGAAVLADWIEKEDDIGDGIELLD